MAATVGKDIRTSRGGGGGVLPYKVYIWVCAAVKGMVFRPVCLKYGVEIR